MNCRPPHSSLPTAGRRLCLGNIARLTCLFCVACTVVAESSSGESRGWPWRADGRQSSDNGDLQGQQMQNAEGFTDEWHERGSTEQGYQEQYYPQDAGMGLPFDDRREFRDSEAVFGDERYPYQSTDSTGPFGDGQPQQFARSGPPPSMPPPPPGSFASDRNRKGGAVDNSFRDAQRERMSFRSPKDSSYTPIHYNFPVEKKTSPAGDDEESPLPDTFSSDDRTVEEDPPEDYSSPRRDVVTRFTATRRGKATLLLSSGSVGATVGAYLGKSLINSPRPLAEIGFGVAVFTSLLRNSYGDLSQAIGMAMILALQRTSSIRSRYPTWRHIKASVGAAERQPFPPTRNPWTYAPSRPRDVEFRMLYSVIAMAAVGSTCGGSLPVLPAWLGALLGVAFFGYSTTMQNARGDLARTMGMRVVSLCLELLRINSELGILGKAGVVSGKILDKIFILDRKHRIKDRLLASFKWIYEKVSNQVSRVQQDMNESSTRPKRERPEPTNR